MLVVLAVFVILAGMFIMSSREVMIKTRYSSALSGEKTIANALERYETDSWALPTESEGLSALIHPLSYLTYVPIDPFTRNDATPREYQYFRDLAPQVRWIVVSVGPDGEADVKNAIEARRAAETTPSDITLSGFGARQSPPKVFKTQAEFNQFITEHGYDPTNGVDSKGDVITVYGR